MRRHANKRQQCFDSIAVCKSTPVAAHKLPQTSRPQTQVRSWSEWVGPSELVSELVRVGWSVTNFLLQQTLFLSFFINTHHCHSAQLLTNLTLASTLPPFAAAPDKNDAEATGTLFATACGNCSFKRGASCSSDAVSTRVETGGGARRGAVSSAKGGIICPRAGPEGPCTNPPPWFAVFSRQ